MSLLADLSEAATFNGLDAAGVEVDHPAGITYALELRDGNATAGALRIDVRGEEAWFLDLTLDSEEDRNAGYFTHLCSLLPALFRDAGVKTFCAVAANPEAEEIFTRAGFAPRERDGALAVSVEADPSPLEEYARGTSDD